MIKKYSRVIACAIAVFAALLAVVLCCVCTNAKSSTDGAEVDPDTVGCSCGCGEEDCTMACCTGDDTGSGGDDTVITETEEEWSDVMVDIELTAEQLNRLYEKIQNTTVLTITRSVTEQSSGMDAYEGVESSIYVYDSTDNRVYSRGGEDITDNLLFDMESVADPLSFYQAYLAYRGVPDTIRTEDIATVSESAPVALFSSSVSCEELDGMAEELEAEGYTDIQSGICYNIGVSDGEAESILYISLCAYGSRSNEEGEIENISRCISYGFTYGETR